MPALVERPDLTMEGCRLPDLQDCICISILPYNANAKTFIVATFDEQRLNHRADELLHIMGSGCWRFYDAPDARAKASNFRPPFRGEGIGTLLADNPFLEQLQLPCPAVEFLLQCRPRIRETHIAIEQQPL